ncbi:MAG: formylglycine-generating enzyme family protein [Pseudomonadota bacterium]|nr:formylglycine-generating enzyme family protein [Pseudomonadota bacterium]
MAATSSTLGLALAALAVLLGGAVHGADYVSIPAGKLTSVLSGGSAADVPIALSAFAMRSTPVSNREFQAFIDAHPAWRRGAAPALFADDSYLHRHPLQPMADAVATRPVTSVSWFAAQAFCESEGARLPTWYEWEYVAAADATRTDARRDPAWRAAILAWYGQSSRNAPASIGGAANVYGVRDVHGLIWEWVDDFNALLVSADSRNQGDPDQLQFCGAGAISLQDRDNYAILMRIALLSSLRGADTTDNLGFRCAKPLPKELP